MLPCRLPPLANGYARLFLLPLSAELHKAQQVLRGALVLLHFLCVAASFHCSESHSNYSKFPCKSFLHSLFLVDIEY